MKRHGTNHTKNIILILLSFGVVISHKYCNVKGIEASGKRKTM